jgi:hypothetical protein
MQQDRYYKIIGVFLLFIALFNFPILGLFNKPSRLFGIPLLFVYIFAAWALLVFILYRIIEKK